EAFLSSIDEKKAFNFFDDYFTKKDEKALKEINNLKKRAEEAYNKSCDVCKLFGGREFAGKLQFKDCYLIGEPSYEHRDGVGIDRETGAAKRTAKYDFEIVSKDSEFEFTMIADNLDDKQKNYFDFIITAMNEGNLAIGGKTTRGLGRFKIVDTEIKEITADKMKAKLDL
ncbi:MAG: CRISPR-associated RAMP protein, partial [Oscillospiraceae bacterium]|nr:CRISPR-associated RAMP protein [Oscillospiraceae bacterium]